MTIEDAAGFLLFIKNHVRLEYIVFSVISYLNLGIFWARFYYATMKNRSMILGTNVSSWDCDDHRTAKIISYVSVFLWPIFLLLHLINCTVKLIGFVLKTLVVNDTKEEEDRFSKNKPNYRYF